jgi:cell division protein FtsB
MSIRRQIFTAIAVLLGTYLTIALSKDLLGLLSARERIAKEQEEVTRLEEEQQELASELEYVSSEEFVEREAREKLLMSKPGEVVVLLPEEDGEKEEPASYEGSGEAKKELANWEKWIQLFGFYKSN